MQSNGDQKRPIKIGAFSGAVGDRFDALQRQAATGNVDLLFGDYLAEANIAWRALEQKEDPSKGYEIGFLRHLESAIDIIATKKLKLITDAGALNPLGLSEAVDALLKSKGHKLKVAYVTGDNLMHRFDELTELGENFEHLEDPNRHISSWRYKPLTANAYCGAKAIVAVLQAGADIIITGRVTDASPVIAAALWWHGWDWTNYDALAGALLAGHCIECGAYITGGNFSGFKQILESYYDFAFPIAEIASDGTFVITKQENNFNGIVTVETVRSQILYEIQGNVYLNPDVQALLDDISVTQEDRDRVRVEGLKGFAPPETTKVAICGLAGYQAEVNYFATGLDIKEKFATVKLQIEKSLGPEGLKKFDVLDYTQYGVAQEDPQSQSEATAMLRLFAQARNIEAFGPLGSLASLGLPDGLGHYPGWHINLDLRMTVPKPYIEYWPARLKIKHLQLEGHLLGENQPISVANHADTIPIIYQADYDSTQKLESLELGPTQRGPLGWIVHARSGDKGGNANVGFFVRHEDEYPWLVSLLSKATLTKLLAQEFVGNKLERVEFPGILAVHFVIHDYLGNGVSSTSRMDSLAKSVAEFLRAKHVDIPKKFLVRGKL